MRRKIESLFRDLKDVEYSYVRSSDYLEDIGSDDDIDLIVLRKDIKKIIKILWKHDFIFLSRYRKSRDIFLYNYKDEDMPAINLHVERLVKMPWINGEELIRRSFADEKGIKVLSEKDRLNVLLLKDLFLTGIHGNKKISESKKQEIELLLKKEENAKEIERILSDTFIFRKKIMKCTQGGYERLHPIRNSLKIYFYMKNVLRIRYFIKNLVQLTFQRMTNRKNMMIAVTGVDGSGKTTACDNILKVLKSTKQNVKYIYMGRWGGHVLPVTKLEKKIGKKSRNVKIENSNPSALKRILRDGFYSLEYFLRLFRIYYLRTKFSFILTDRYVYDLLFVNEPTCLVRFFIKNIYPKPTVLFVLYNDPEKLYSRKGELTVKKLEKQQEILLNLGFGTKIKTENKDETSETILKTILKKRNRKLYRFLD